jgi:hypothetical protein
VETSLKKMLQCRQCLRSIVPEHSKGDFRAIDSTQGHKAKDALSGSFVAFDLDLNGRAEWQQGLYQQGAGTSM